MRRHRLDKLHSDIARIRRSQDSIERRRSIILTELLMARLEQGMSQAQLSKLSGVPQPAIARIERGRVNPTLDTLLKLTRALNRNLMIE